MLISASFKSCCWECMCSLSSFVSCWLSCAFTTANGSCSASVAPLVFEALTFAWCLESFSKPVATAFAICTFRSSSAWSSMRSCNSGNRPDMRSTSVFASVCSMAFCTTIAVR